MTLTNPSNNARTGFSPRTRVVIEEYSIGTPEWGTDSVTLTVHHENVWSMLVRLQSLLDVPIGTTVTPAKEGARMLVRIVLNPPNGRLGVAE